MMRGEKVSLVCETKTRRKISSVVPIESKCNKKKEKRSEHAQSHDFAGTILTTRRDDNVFRTASLQMTVRSFGGAYEDKGYGGTVR